MHYMCPCRCLPLNLESGKSLVFQRPVGVGGLSVILSGDVGEMNTGTKMSSKGPWPPVRKSELMMIWDQVDELTGPGNLEVIARAWRAKLVRESRIGERKGITKQEEGREEQSPWRHLVAGKVGEEREGEKEWVLSGNKVVAHTTV